MLGQLWQRLVRLFQLLFKVGKKPQPVESAPEISHLSDVAYELLFMRLLDRVEWGWDQPQVLAHLGTRIHDHFFKSWLQRFGRDKLLVSPMPNHEIGQRMVKLGKIGCGEIGDIAQELGRQLLKREPKLPESETDQTAETMAVEPTDSPSGADSTELDEAEAWFNRGLTLQNLGRLEAVITSYDHALELKPDFYEAWHNRGNALFDLDCFETAIASYNRAIEIKPNQHEAWNNRGNALANSGSFEAAIASYDRAIQIKPDEYQAWYNRSLALGNLDRLAEAIASYDQAIQIKPDLPRT